MKTQNTNNRIKIHDGNETGERQRQEKKNADVNTRHKNPHALKLRNVNANAETKWRPKNKELTMTKSPKNSQRMHLKHECSKIFNVVFHLECRSFHFIVNCWYYYYAFWYLLFLTCLKLKTEIATKKMRNEEEQVRPQVIPNP